MRRILYAANDNFLLVRAAVLHRKAGRQAVEVLERVGAHVFQGELGDGADRSRRGHQRRALLGGGNDDLFQLNWPLGSLRDRRLLLRHQLFELWLKHHQVGSQLLVFQPGAVQQALKRPHAGHFSLQLRRFKAIGDFVLEDKLHRSLLGKFEQRRTGGLAGNFEVDRLGASEILLGKRLGRAEDNQQEADDLY